MYATDEAFRERRKAASRARYAAETPEQRKARKQAERDKLRAEVIAAYGGKCSCCGTDYEPHLTLDHVNGGGTTERRSLQGGSCWRVARREGYPDRFQLLCFNCNWAKHHLGECGCQTH